MKIRDWGERNPEKSTQTSFLILLLFFIQSRTCGFYKYIFQRWKDGKSISSFERREEREIEGIKEASEKNRLVYAAIH